MESAGLGGCVCGEEESGKKKDDGRREYDGWVEMFEGEFEVGLFDEFDEDVGEKSYRGERGEEEAERPEKDDFASRVTLSGAKSLWRNCGEILRRFAAQDEN